MSGWAPGGAQCWSWRRARSRTARFPRRPMPRRLYMPGARGRGRVSSAYARGARRAQTGHVGQYRRSVRLELKIPLMVQYPRPGRRGRGRVAVAGRAPGTVPELRGSRPFQPARCMPWPSNQKRPRLDGGASLYQEITSTYCGDFTHSG